jgi:hypothetical protein
MQCTQIPATPPRCSNTSGTSRLLIDVRLKSNYRNTMQRRSRRQSRNTRAAIMHSGESTTHHNTNCRNRDGRSEPSTRRNLLGTCARRNHCYALNSCNPCRQQSCSSLCQHSLLSKDMHDQLMLQHNPKPSHSKQMLNPEIVCAWKRTLETPELCNVRTCSTSTPLAYNLGSHVRCAAWSASPNMHQSCGFLSRNSCVAR